MDAKKIVGWVLVVSAINWGLVGLLGMNLIESLVGMDLAKIVYMLIGAVGVYKASMLIMPKGKK